MSYSDQLKEHYKAVRARINAAALQKPKPLLLPTPASFVKEREQEGPPSAGLLSPEADAKIVCEALREANPHWIGGNDAQALQIAKDLMEAPKLPPLPGLNLDEPGAIRWMRVLHAVAKQHHVTKEEILGTSRKRHVVSARFEVFYRLRVDLRFSYTKIAALMKRDHTTILHGVHKVKESLLDLLGQTPDDGGPLVVHHPAASGNTPGSAYRLSP
jgi:hypothetical protein